ncbi:MAG: heavy-metal-associated domain-containing protein [Bacteroidetes bacterium]|nr:MAG: heavy-metal-associated domain-containing protein [Bacteroidota bacterium]
MKTLKNILALVLIAIIFTACKNEVKSEVKTVEVETNIETAKKELDPNATYAKAEFTIDGMTCAIGCAKTIEKKIAKMDGVKSASVDFDRRLAMVEYDEAIVNPMTLEETVTKVADIYKVSDMKTVDSFSSKLDDAEAMSHMKECSVKCSPDCTEKDCSKCAEKTAECKKKCEAKKAEVNAGDKKMACANDCKKECCAGKKAKA